MKILALLFLLWSDLSWQGKEEQGIQVEATLEKKRLPVDEKIQLELTVMAPAGYSLDFSLLKQEMIGDANVVSERLEVTGVQEEEEIKLPQGKVKKSVSFTFNPLVTGKYPLSLQRIPFVKGKEIFYYSGPLWVVEVEPVPFHPEKAKELVAPFLPVQQGPLYTIREDNQALLQNRLQDWQTQAFPLVKALFIFFLGSLFLLIWYFRDFLEEKIKNRWFPPADPHQVLLKQLKQSVKADEWGSVLKKTLELQWQKPATRWTTKEIINYISPEKRECLSASLQKLDALRYGNMPLTTEEQEKLHRHILELVE